MENHRRTMVGVKPLDIFEYLGSLQYQKSQTCTFSVARLERGIEAGDTKYFRTHPTKSHAQNKPAQNHKLSLMKNGQMHYYALHFRAKSTNGHYFKCCCQ